MTLLPRARNAPERMDHDGVDPAALQDALGHVAAVNRWLGARRALLSHLSWALPVPRDGAVRILDVGTGSADLPLAVAAWGRARGRSLSITAVDRHEGTILAARRRTHPWPEIRPVRGDGLRLPFAEGEFDLALLSMTLHHMDGAALEGLLREAARVARGGRILVGELRRSVPSYLGARFLAATVWRRNPVTRHDGPLSVRRAFTPRELDALALAAGLHDARVFRHPLFRLVLRALA